MRHARHRSMVTAPSAFSSAADPYCRASSFDIVCCPSFAAGGSFCPQPSQERPSSRSMTHPLPHPACRAPHQQQPRHRVDRRRGAQAHAHSPHARRRRHGYRRHPAAQPSNRIHHAYRRRPPLRRHHVMQRCPDVGVVHAFEEAETHGGEHEHRHAERPPGESRKGTPANNPTACVHMRPRPSLRTQPSATIPPVSTPSTDAACRYAVALKPAIVKLMWKVRVKYEGSHVRNTMATKFAPMNTAISATAMGLRNTSTHAPEKRNVSSSRTATAGGSFSRNSSTTPSTTPSEPNT